MQLWSTPSSPFARKVRVTIHELGLTDRIELVVVNPWTDPRLRALNPLAKVPTLVLDDGSALFESGVICEYLDALASRPRLYPAPGPERWRALRLQGLADGAATAAGRLFADEHRPEHDRSQAVMRRLGLAIDGCLGALEDEALFGERITIGDIAVAVFAEYLDFRWPDRDWRGARPRLAAGCARFAARSSMTSTPYATLAP